MALSSFCPSLKGAWQSAFITVLKYKSHNGSKIVFNSKPYSNTLECSNIKGPETQLQDSYRDNLHAKLYDATFGHA